MIRVLTGSREIQHQAQWTWSPIQICVHGAWRFTWNSMDGTKRENCCSPR